MRPSAPAAFLLVALCAATAAPAQEPCAVYDASLGSAPDDQGWGLSEASPASYQVAGGVLSMSTLPFTSAVCPTSSHPQHLSWTVPSPDFHFDDGAVLEAEVRIVSSQDGQNPCSLWPRPGFLLAMRDVTLRNAYLGLVDSKLILFNDPYLVSGAPGHVEVPFDTTDGFHLYRLEVDAGGIELWVDGVHQLSQGHGLPAATTPAVVVGDSTIWANSDARVRSMHFTSGSATWCDRGHALAGTPGDPILSGTGPLTAGSVVGLDLANGHGGQPAFLVAGSTEANLPLFGGHLVPLPDLLVFQVVTDAAGQLSLSATWPALPPGTPIYWQVLVLDPGAPAGVAFSNGLLSISH